MRYAEFFKDNAQFLTTTVGWFFAKQGIRNESNAIASQAVNLFLRLTEKFRHSAIFPSQAESIATHLMALINDCETGIVSQETLGFSEVQDLYSVLGVLASTEAVPEAFRVQLLNWALER